MTTANGAKKEYHAPPKSTIEHDSLPVTTSQVEVAHIDDHFDLNIKNNMASTHKLEPIVPNAIQQQKQHQNQNQNQNQQPCCSNNHNNATTINATKGKITYLPVWKPEFVLNDRGLFSVYCFFKDFIGASGTSAVAIDNKIEQAMDLVKSHLMIAVREEVEVLKERISELMDKINQLEVENTILKANISQETLQQLQLQTQLQIAGSASSTAAAAGSNMLTAPPPVTSAATATSGTNASAPGTTVQTTTGATANTTNADATIVENANATVPASVATATNTSTVAAAANVVNTNSVTGDASTVTGTSGAGAATSSNNASTNGPMS